VLVVQERRRFYRECITASLRRQLRRTNVAEGVPDAAGLLALSTCGPVTHAVVEADGVPWDVPTMAGTIRAQHPGVHLIGLSSSARPAALDGLVLLPHGATPEQVAELVEGGSERTTPFVLSTAETNGNGPLTSQQLRVLALLSLGLTVAGAAARLGLSERAVAKSKQVIFSKLGAQSQAQAVATAVSIGLLGPAPHAEQT
jgi:DNA-binding CsgD family transcriptional regulator